MAGNNIHFEEFKQEEIIKQYDRACHIGGKAEGMNFRLSFQKQFLETGLRAGPAGKRQLHPPTSEPDWGRLGVLSPQLTRKMYLRPPVLLPALTL